MPAWAFFGLLLSVLIKTEIIRQAMSGSLFTPRVYQEQPQQPRPQERTETPDRIGATVLNLIQYIVVGFLFIVPVFFVPGLPASLGFDKVLITAIGSFFIVVLLGLTALRYSRVSTVLPLSLGAFWLFVAVAFISGLLSGDIQDSLRGSVFESQTAGFFAVMALMMTIPLVLQRNKNMALKTIMAFGASAMLLVLYTLVRVFLESGSLALKSFGNVTTSPVGSFNDMAIFSGLTVILGLITLLQLPLKKAYQIATTVLILLSLVVMAVVNFFHLWIVVGFVGLLLLVYIFSRDTLLSRGETERQTPVSPLLILTTLVVCVVSIVFVVAGDYVGSKIVAATEVNYVEVRPSITATLDIARGVYSEDILLGVGPNRFADAWRIHKDRTINETIFWNTDFNAGFGFIPTIFITMGILGALAMLAFHGLYLYLGYRMLLRSNSNDTFWYYFGVVTFTAATFIWGMSYMYVSGPTILLLGALFTGLSFVAYQALVPNAALTIPLVNSRRRGFFLMTVVIVLITAAVSTVFTVGKQYVAQSEFTKARISAATPEEFEQKVALAYEQYNDDVFVGVLAQTHLTILRSLLTKQEATEEDQKMFADTAKKALVEAEESIKLDPTSPDGHATLADILIVLASLGTEGAEERAKGKLADAKWRDPHNPAYAMMAAYLAVQSKDTGTARTEIARALELKRNYSEALFLQTQLDIQDGNIDGAIKTATEMTTLESNNPTRYYQLGVLYAAKKDYEAAIRSYETAINLDNNFANARYMMALSMLESNRTQDALTQLRLVRDTNQDNEELKKLIQQVETNGYVPGQTSAQSGGSVQEPAPQGGETVTAPGDPNTNLVTPVNNVPNGQTQGQAPQNPAPQATPAQ
jgi:tetratricopeptide (TPR) repeat protein